MSSAPAPPSGAAPPLPPPLAPLSPVALAAAAATAASEAAATAAADDENAAAVERLARRRAHIDELRARGGAYYSDYLCLPQLLSLQQPLSRGAGADLEAHDETLFVIIHQTYELWFKQVLHEVDSVRRIFAAAPVDDKLIVLAVARLGRVREIQRVLIQQIAILETMTASSFLEFRDFLYPASGFQSVQFRLIENRLGLRADARLAYGQRGYCSYLQDGGPQSDAAAVRASEREASLFDLVEAWLERTPFVGVDADEEAAARVDAGAGVSAGTGAGAGAGAADAETGFAAPPRWSWWAHYRAAVGRMLAADEEAFLSSPRVSGAEREAAMRDLAAAREHFATVLDAGRHAAAREQGLRRLSHRALQAALLITLYADEPILQLPNQLLASLVDVDAQLTAWRHRHALMVHRMIGTKLGTGGSTGYHYLRATAERHKIFGDIAGLATYLVPRHMMPPLPPEVRAQLAFAFVPSAPTKEAAARANEDAASASAASLSASRAASGVDGGAASPARPSAASLRALSGGVGSVAGGGGGATECPMGFGAGERGNPHY